jgi:hypothetical protein
MKVKSCLFDIYNDILATEVVPQSWHRKEVEPIVKSGKDPLSCSYRPISLFACGRKLMQKMICNTRLNFWAEKNGILSPTQHGFRKGKGTRNFRAMMTTDISTSFEMKKQTVAAFLDISGAYDNVLIDVLCGVILETELPLGIVRFMWSLLWCKTLVFCVGGAECMTLTGYKGLQQGSVLSPFLYNLLGSAIGLRLPSIDFLLVTLYVFQTACALGQSACSSLSVFYRCLDSRYPLQSWRWYCSLGGTCDLRSRSGLVANCCHK